MRMLTLIKSALELTEGSGYETPARKLVWGLTELVKAGVLQHSLQDLEKLHKRTIDKAQLICLVDEFEEQKLERNATKKDLLKLRDEKAVQHQATFKQVVEINEKASSHDEKTTTHNQKMKTILIQVNDLLEHLDQSLLKRSEADYTNNKALLRVITDPTKIRGLINDLNIHKGHTTPTIKEAADIQEEDTPYGGGPTNPQHRVDDHMEVDTNTTVEGHTTPTTKEAADIQEEDTPYGGGPTNPQHQVDDHMEVDTNTTVEGPAPLEATSQTQGNAQHPIVVSSQTQTQEGNALHPIEVPSQTQDPGTPKEARLKEAQTKKKNEATRNGGTTTKWKPEIIPHPEMDAEALGLKNIDLRVNQVKRWPPHPSVEDVTEDAKTPPRTKTTV